MKKTLALFLILFFIAGITSADHRSVIARMNAAGCASQTIALNLTDTVTGCAMLAAQTRGFKFTTSAFGAVKQIHRIEVYNTAIAVNGTLTWRFGASSDLTTVYLDSGTTDYVTGEAGSYLVFTLTGLPTVSQSTAYYIMWHTDQTVTFACDTSAPTSEGNSYWTKASPEAWTGLAETDGYGLTIRTYLCD